MRFLAILIELLVIGGLIALAFSLVRNMMHENKKEKKWKQWQNLKVKSHKDITISDMKNDLEELNFVLKDKIPAQALASFEKIRQTIEILSQQETTFNEWKNTYSDESSDLLDILYKHMPESLNRYFSVPKSMADTQKHRNGKNAHQLLDETFAIFERRVNEISKEIISENLNKLKTYQSFVQTKFEEKEWE